MDTNEIFNAGGVQIPNPNYSKSKKNKEPQFITVSDLNNAIPTSNPLVDTFYDADKAGNMVAGQDYKDAEKYLNYGINPYKGESNIDYQLADAQSNLEKGYNSLAQTVSEVVLGIGLGFSNLADMIGTAVGVSDDDYTNPVSTYLEQVKKDFEENHPIYATPNTNITNGGLLNFGWYASNIPSIASSLTMLLPSRGIVMGLSKAGQLAKVASHTRSAVRTITRLEHKLNKIQDLRAAGKLAEADKVYNSIGKFSKLLNSSSTANKASLLLENGTTAALMRSMENYQEARQTYNDMYKKASDILSSMTSEQYNDFLKNNANLIKERNVSEEDKNDRDKMAKLIAINSADKTFQMDWLNVASDVIQLYALRNAWKGIKNADAGSAAVRRANIDAAKYFGKSLDEIKEIKANLPLSIKIKDKIFDHLYASKLVIGAELGEGVEEAVNYIAQQEGMSFGKAMLNGKAKEEHTPSYTNSIASFFDTRILQYAKHPELLDSAFWGVMGGVTFQTVGSQINKLRYNWQNNKSDANESIKNRLNDLFMSELPEIKRRKSEIEARNRDFVDYSNKLKKIKQGIDIYKSGPNNEEVHFTSDEAKQLAEEKLRNEFITNMTIRAMNTGNLDMLKAYIADPNVRKGMINAGLFNDSDNTNDNTNQDIETNSKQYIENCLRTIDSVEKAYDFELNAVNYATAFINVKYKDENSIPIEYIQSIAINNVAQRLDIESTNKELNAINTRIAELENDPNSKLDKNIDYDNAIRIGILTNQLGILRAQYRAIKDDNSLSANIVKYKIKKQIENIEDNLNNEELKYATFVSLQYFQDEKGNIQQAKPNDKRLEASYIYRDKAITEAIEEGKQGKLSFDTTMEELNELSNKALASMTSSEIGRYRTLEQDADKAFRQLDSENPELNQLYQTKHILNQRIANDNLEIYRTAEEVKHEVNVLHNTMDMARNNAINSAVSTINQIYKKSDEQTRKAIQQAISDKMKNVINDIEVPGLSKEDSGMFNSAMECLALDKAHNKALAETLAANIGLIEIEEMTAEVERDDNTNNTNSQNSTNSNQAISDQNNNGSTTTSTPNNKPSDKPKNDQNSQTNTGTTSSTNNKTLKLQPDGTFKLDANTDGTYTFIPANNKSYQNNLLFTNSNDIDLTRDDVIVETNPILKQVDDKTSSYEVVTPGRLAYKNDSQQGSTQQTQQSNTQQGTTQPTSTSSTGVVGSAPNTTTNTISSADPNTSQPVITQTSSDEDNNRVYTSFLYRTIQKAKKENPDYNIDELAKNVIDNFVKNGHDRDTVTKAINTFVDKIKAKNNVNTNALQSCIDEVYIEQNSMIVEANGITFGDEFIKATENLINLYCKEVGITKINNKIYINLENMLRYINEHTSDKNNANYIYKSLINYLDTDKAKALFVTTDEEIGSQQFVENFNKSSKERYDEKIKDIEAQRIDILTFPTKANDRERKDFYDALDEMQKGDKISYYELNGIIYFKDQKGRICGTVPVPTVTNDNCYDVINDDWHYHINSYDNSDPLMTFFKRILKNSTSADKDFNTIIFEYAFGHPTAERKEELLKAFVESECYQEALNEGFVKPSTGKKALNGIVKLWRFVNASDIYEHSDIISDYIDTWFEKLKNSYDSVVWLKNNQNASVVIDTVSDGDFIYTCENQDVTMPQKALPVSEALSKLINIDDCKVAVATGTANTISLSGGSTRHHTAVTKGRVFVAVPNRNGTFHHVQAFPAMAKDAFIGQDAKDLMNDIVAELKRLMLQFANSSDENRDDAFNEIYNFLFNVFSSKNNNSLFEGNIVALKNDCIIFGPDNRQTKQDVIYLHKLDNFGNKGAITHSYITEDNETKNENHQYNTREAINAITNIIKNYTRFKVAFSYVCSDGNNNIPLKGICSRDANNNFVITVGGKQRVYKSFNEFMLKNNLLKLNTHPIEGSNFRRRSESNMQASQQVKIRIERLDNSTTPVEKNANVSSTVVTTKPINEQAIDILNSDSNNKGIELASLAIEDKESLKDLKDLKMLPSNIIFDEKFNTIKGNESVNAEVDTNTGAVTVGSKWVTMFGNPNTRIEAIRKLIHEELHNKISKKRDVIRTINSVITEFKEFLDNNEDNEWYKQFRLAHNLTKEQADAHFRQYLYENTNYTDDVKLEEFLVESISSKELVEFLNNIKTKEDVKGSKGLNLWQKLMKAFAKLLGININKGSLYEKEFKIIGRALSTNDTIEERKAKRSAEDIVNQIVADGENVVLTKNERYYINTQEQMLYSRVTSTIAADEKGHAFDPNSPWVIPSTNIGTGVDEFVRDFFLGKLDNLSNDELEQNYPNATGEQWAKFRYQLNDFKNRLLSGSIIKDKQITIVSRDIKATGTVDVQTPDGVKQLPVNGTIDLLGYDQNGEFYIFDMKTIHEKGTNSDALLNRVAHAFTNNDKKWALQLSLYKKFLEDKYNIKVADIGIIPIGVEYSNPIDVEYEVKDPDKKLNYDDPTRTQLLEDDDEFRDANPTLISDINYILHKKPVNINIQYDKLDENTKALVDGTVNFNNFNDVEVSSENNNNSNITTNNTTSVNTSESTSGKFTPTDIISVRTGRKRRSGIDEVKKDDNNPTISVPSITGFINLLPAKNRVKMVDYLTDSNILAICR